MADTGDVTLHIDSVAHRYNPENDTIPGAPAVTWADAQMAEAVLKLTLHVAWLQNKVYVLEQQVKDLETVQRRNMPL